MLTREMILSFLSEHKDDLAQNYGITSIGLFGSYARNEQHEQSDIDLAIEMESENTFRSFFALKVYLEKAFQRTVDLGMAHTLKPAVKSSVEKEIIYV